MNLFAAGLAELVTDAALSTEPLAKPGVVVKRPRGTAEEHVAALPTGQSESRTAPAERDAKVGRAGRAKARPRPSRVALDRAEAELAEALERHRAADEEIGRRIAMLERERKEMRDVQSREVARLERRRDKLRDAFEATLAKWRN